MQEELEAARGRLAERRAAKAEEDELESLAAQVERLEAAIGARQEQMDE
jgi:hypothetical protein